MMRMAFLLCMGMMMNYILIMRKLTKNYENTFTDLNSSGKHNIFYKNNPGRNGAGIELLKFILTLELGRRLRTEGH